MYNRVQRKCLIAVCYFIYLKVFEINCQKHRLIEFYEVGPCSNLTYKSNCIQDVNCPAVMDQIRSTGTHRYKTCGFDEKDNQLVCCPDLASPPTRPPTNKEEPDPIDNPVKRKSELKCEQMIKDIHTEKVTFHVLNGTNAASGEFPHMAALEFEPDNDGIKYKCGAVLISPRFLLTAAHCIFCIKCTNPLKARFGVVDKNDDQAAHDIEVKNVTVHERFHPTYRNDDIAIVELVQNVIFNTTIYPACLYTTSDDPPNMTVTGWGQTGNHQPLSDILQVGEIQPVPVEQCNKTYQNSFVNTRKTISNSQICGTTISDACPGDSGGPLQIKMENGRSKIVGIVSYGIACGSKHPGVYTRVYSYLDWIEEIVWP